MSIYSSQQFEEKQSSQKSNDGLYTGYVENNFLNELQCEIRRFRTLDVTYISKNTFIYIYLNVCIYVCMHTYITMVIRMIEALIR